jgi:transposase
MRAYSQDLRDRVLRALERGEGPTGIARRFEVSRMWVYQVRRRFEREGSRESLRQGGYRISRIAHWEETIRGWIAAEVDLTLAELSERLAGLGVSLKVSALWHQLDQWGLRFKKNAARQRARTRRRAAGAGSLDSSATVSGREVVEIHR